jgi:ABC-type Fe3+ transport system permease subunit
VQTVGGRETLFPWVAVLVGLSLPAAVLLRQVLRRTAAAASTHAARLLGGRRGRSLVWELDTRRHAAAVCLLFCGTYFELTASAILAPIGMTPVTVRLYNLMHYGQTAVLSAMVLAAFLAPMAVALMLLGVRRIGVRA